MKSSSYSSAVLYFSAMSLLLVMFSACSAARTIHAVAAASTAWLPHAARCVRACGRAYTPHTVRARTHAHTRHTRLHQRLVLAQLLLPLLLRLVCLFLLTRRAHLRVALRPLLGLVRLRGSSRAVCLALPCALCGLQHPARSGPRAASTCWRVCVRACVRVPVHAHTTRAALTCFSPSRSGLSTSVRVFSSRLMMSLTLRSTLTFLTAFSLWKLTCAAMHGGNGSMVAAAWQASLKLGCTGRVRVRAHVAQAHMTSCGCECWRQHPTHLPHFHAVGLFQVAPHRVHDAYVVLLAPCTTRGRKQPISRASCTCACTRCQRRTPVVRRCYPQPPPLPLPPHAHPGWSCA